MRHGNGTATHPFSPDFAPIARANFTNSLGIIMIVIVFSSAPTSVIICIRRISSPGRCPAAGTGGVNY